MLFGICVDAGAYIEELLTARSSYRYLGVQDVFTGIRKGCVYRGLLTHHMGYTLTWLLCSFYTQHIKSRVA